MDFNDYDSSSGDDIISPSKAKNARLKKMKRAAEDNAEKEQNDSGRKKTNMKIKDEVDDDDDKAIVASDNKRKTASTSRQKKKSTSASSRKVRVRELDSEAPLILLLLLVANKEIQFLRSLFVCTLPYSLKKTTSCVTEEEACREWYVVLVEMSE